MWPIVRICWDICLFRRGPQALPASPVLLALVLAAYLVMDGILGLASGLGTAANLRTSLVDTAMLGAFCALLLFFWRRLPRFNQTLLAFAGSGVVLMLVSLPLAALTRLSAHPALAATGSYLALGIVLWNIAVMAFILHHALEVRPWIAWLLAFPYQILNIIVLSLIGG